MTGNGATKVAPYRRAELLQWQLWVLAVIKKRVREPKIQVRRITVPGIFQLLENRFRKSRR